MPPYSDLGPEFTEREVISPHFSAPEVAEILKVPPRNIDQIAPVVPWPDFYDRLFQWKQDQHAGIIGPTDSGKTNLAYHLLAKRIYRAVFALKAKDKTLSALLDKRSIVARRYGLYRAYSTWQTGDSNVYPRRILWPREYLSDLRALITKNPNDPRELAAAAHIFADAMIQIYADPGWCVFADDLWFICNILKLKQYVQIYLMMCRSLPVPLLVASQRPAWIPLEVYDQSTHLFFFRDNDEMNLSRISGIAWLSAEEIVRIVATLPMWQTLYLNTRTGFMCRTTAPDVWR